MTSAAGSNPDVRIIGVRGIPMVEAGDDLAGQIIEAAASQDTPFEDGDLLVVTQRVVSKAEGQVVPLDQFTPSAFALDYADRFDKDPRVVEAVLRESTRVIRQVAGVLITETRHGFKCANAGVDASNVGGEDLISLLPVDPDASCRDLRDTVRERLGVEVAVVMTDTFGRPWRHGQTNIAIGVAGLLPMRSYVGTEDLDGVELRVTEICVADEIAGAAELVMGKVDAIPVAIMRGYDYDHGEGSSAEIVRESELDLFP
jgi:coenzyme F420-0:L-glutamate ligase/coenzyme F420-1:gamma-L-glutamate ligase